MERSLPACSLSGNRNSSSSMDSVVAVAGRGGGGGGGGGGGDIGVGFINPTPLASRCGKPCGSSSEALRSSWIQRLIPGVLGDFGGGGGGGGLSSSSCVRQSPEGGALCQSQAPAGGGQGQQQQPLQDKQRLGHEVLGHGPDKVQGRDDEVQETRPLLLGGSTEQGEEGEREGEGHGHGHGSHGSEETGKESGFSRSCGLQTAESSQHFSRGNPRRWRLKPPVSPVEPSGWPATGHKYYYAGRRPNMSSGKQEMWPTSSDAPPDMIVSGPCATVLTSAIGLRDSASDCAQFMDVEPQCAKEKEEEQATGIACSQLNPLQQPVAREVYIGVKSYSVESYHPSVSSSFLPYRQWQGGQQSGAGGISRPVLLQGTHSQFGGEVSELSPAATAAAAGVSQLIQSQKAKQEVGTSHDYEKREGGATMVTDNMIKEKDATSFRSSPLPPLALFEPFKHVTKKQQRCGGKGKVDEGVSLLTPLFPPLSYLGIDDVPKEGVTGCPTERLDKHSSPVLTPVYEPYKQTGDHSGGSRTDKGKFADKSLVMTPILPSLKSPRDQNELSEGPSQCSSKTASLPPDVIAPLDLDAYDSVNGREGISGQNCDTESKQHRGSSMCALRQSYNSNPVVMPADQQIQPLHEHIDMGVRPLGFGFGRNIPHVPTASSRVKWLSNEQSPTPSPPYRTDYNNVIDRSRGVKDLSTTQSLELAKSSSTQGTGSQSKGPAGQPRHGHSTQLEVPIRKDPRGFYFPLSEGSCGSNPLVPIGDRSAGQHAPLFQPALSNGHTVSIRHLSPANRQPVYGRGSRLSVGLCGEAELQTQDLGQDDQGRREARMDLVKEEKEIGIAKRKGHPVVRMDKDLQQTGDGCDGTLLKKCTKVSPIASEDLSLQPKEEDLPAGTLPEAEVPMEDSLQLPARAQAWLQRWMPLSKPAAGTVKPLRAMLDPKASLGGHQFSSIKTVIGSSVRAEPSLPEASKLHADGKSQHDLELQGSHSATEANQPACVKQANHNVEGSFGDDHRRPSVFGAGVPSAAALALLGVATRTDMP